MLKVELRTKNNSVIKLEDTGNVTTRMVLSVEVSDVDQRVHGGVPLGSHEVIELVNGLKAI